MTDEIFIPIGKLKQNDTREISSRKKVKTRA